MRRACYSVVRELESWGNARLRWWGRRACYLMWAVGWQASCDTLILKFVSTWTFFKTLFLNINSPDWTDGWQVPTNAHTHVRGYWSQHEYSVGFTVIVKHVSAYLKNGEAGRSLIIGFVTVTGTGTVPTPLAGWPHVLHNSVSLLLPGGFINGRSIDREKGK